VSLPQPPPLGGCSSRPDDLEMAPTLSMFFPLLFLLGERSLALVVCSPLGVFVLANLGSPSPPTSSLIAFRTFFILPPGRRLYGQLFGMFRGLPRVMFFFFWRVLRPRELCREPRGCAPVVPILLLPPPSSLGGAYRFAPPLTALGSCPFRCSLSALMWFFFFTPAAPFPFSGLVEPPLPLCFSFPSVCVFNVVDNKFFSFPGPSVHSIQLELFFVFLPRADDFFPFVSIRPLPSCRAPHSSFLVRLFFCFLRVNLLFPWVVFFLLRLTPCKASSYEGQGCTPAFPFPPPPPPPFFRIDRLCLC